MLRTTTKTADTAAITFYNLLVGGIARVSDVVETIFPKPGNGGQKILEAESNVIRDEDAFPEGGGAEDKDEDRRHRGYHILQPSCRWDRAGVQCRRDRPPKPRNSSLKLLEAVSIVIRDEGIVPEGGGAEDQDEDRRHHGHHILQPAGGWDCACD